MELNNSGILDKVNFLMLLAKRGQYSQEELDLVKDLMSEHSDHIRLGKVFGYSVSDYAFATLNWLSTDETKTIFNQQYNQLSPKRKQIVSELIDKNLYMQY